MFLAVFVKNCIFAHLTFKLTFNLEDDHQTDPMGQYFAMGTSKFV